MNTDATSQHNALLNRLILLVLSLILVCLVLLVVRAYSRPGANDANGPTAALTEPPAIMEEPNPEVAMPVVPAAKPQGTPGQSSPRVEPAIPKRAPSSGPGYGRQASAETGVDPVPAAIEYPPPAIRIDSAVVGAPPVVLTGPGIGSELANADIIGLVTLAGQAPAEIPIPLTPACGRLSKSQSPTTRHYVVDSEGRLANVIVYVSAGTHGKYRPPENPAIMDQVGCMYQPYVLGLQTRQTLQIRNSDPEMHNVHFTARNNPERNFVMLKGQMNNAKIENPELFLRINCDVHPWMFAYLGVFDHPYFAISDTNGLVRLPNGLRAGHYTVTAAHLKAGTISQEIDLQPGKQKALLFQFLVPGKAQAQNKGQPTAE
jgi:hypothetical protein